MTSMMALRAHVRGGPEQLRYEEAPVPVLGAGDVLVAVHAAGITFELQHAMFFIVEPDPDGLAGLAERASTKSLRPVISQEFPLAEGRQAYESDRHRRPPGKTVLVVR